MRDVNERDIGKMLAMKRYAKLNVTQIAKELKFSRPTIRKWTARGEDGDEIAVVPRVPNKTHVKKVKLRRSRLAAIATEIESWQRVTNKNRIYKTKRKYRIVQVVKYPSAADMAGAMLRRHKTKMSPATVRRDLVAMNFRLRARGSVPAMTPEHKNERVVFCKWAKTLPDAVLHKWVFSDEKWFNSNDHTSNYQWVAPGQKPLPKWRSQSAPKVMLFGAMTVGAWKMIGLPHWDDMLQDELLEKQTAAAVAKAAWDALPKKEQTKRNNAKAAAVRSLADKQLARKIDRAKRGLPPAKIAIAKQDKVPRALTTPRYIEHCVRPCLPLLTRPGRQFMQDNAGPHLNDAQLEELGITGIGMKWPSKSPDLNPIENLWAIMQRKVSQRGPHSAAELSQFAVEELDTLGPQVVDNLVKSFRRRCEECIKRRGECVKF
jgi:transposase